MSWPRPKYTTVTSVQLLRNVPEWWKDPNTVYIGMPGKAQRALGIPNEYVGPFGKPWNCEFKPDGSKYPYDEIFERYRAYLKDRLRTDPAFREAVAGLAGKTLVCWCKGKRGEMDKKCHGDILAVAAELLTEGETQ